MPRTAGGRHDMKKYHWLAIALLSAFLVGCGTKLVYNRLDWLLLFKVDRYVNLQDSQQQYLKQVFSGFHSWHRSTQLPTYVVWLGALRERLGQPVTPEFWEQVTQDGKLLAERSRQYLLPAMVETAAGLTDAQVSHLLKKIGEKREELADIVKKKPTDRIKEHRKDMRKSVRRWLGRLSDSQEDAIHAWAESLEPFEDDLYATNLEWERQLRAALDARADRAALQQAMDVLTAVEADRLAPEVQAVVDRNQLRTYHLLSDLVNGASSKQRAHLDERLANYQRDFEELAQGAPLPAKAAAGLRLLSRTP